MFISKPMLINFAACMSLALMTPNAYQHPQIVCKTSHLYTIVKGTFYVDGFIHKLQCLSIRPSRRQGLSEINSIHKPVHSMISLQYPMKFAPLLLLFWLYYHSLSDSCVYMYLFRHFKPQQISTKHDSYAYLWGTLSWIKALTFILSDKPPGMLWNWRLRWEILYGTNQKRLYIFGFWCGYNCQPLPRKTILIVRS